MDFNIGILHAFWTVFRYKPSSSKDARILNKATCISCRGKEGTLDTEHWTLDTEILKWKWCEAWGSWADISHIQGRSRRWRGISSSPFTHLVLGESSVSSCQRLGGAEDEGRLVENMFLFPADFFKLKGATEDCDLLDTKNWEGYQIMQFFLILFSGIYSNTIFF